MWRITKDHGAKLGSKPGTNENAIGIMGPYGVKEEDTPKCIYPFRMFDDDGELYYEGISSEHGSFDPLDDFGEPNAGCTYIMYKNQKTKKWEIL